LAPMQLKLMRWLLRWAVFVITIHAGLIGHFSEASTDTSIHILQTDVPMEVSVDKGETTPVFQFDADNAGTLVVEVCSGAVQHIYAGLSPLVSDTSHILALAGTSQLGMFRLTVSSIGTGYAKVYSSVMWPIVFRIAFLRGRPGTVHQDTRQRLLEPFFNIGYISPHELEAKLYFDADLRDLNETVLYAAYAAPVPHSEARHRPAGHIESRPDTACGVELGQTRAEGTSAPSTLFRVQGSRPQLMLEGLAPDQTYLVAVAFQLEDQGLWRFSLGHHVRTPMHPPRVIAGTGAYTVPYTVAAGEYDYYDLGVGNRKISVGVVPHEGDPDLFVRCGGGLPSYDIYDGSSSTPLVESVHLDVAAESRCYAAVYGYASTGATYDLTMKIEKYNDPDEYEHIESSDSSSDGESYFKQMAGGELYDFGCMVVRVIFFILEVIA